MEPTDRTKYDARLDVIRALACAMVAIVHFSVPTWTSSLVDRGLIVDTVALGLIHTGWLGVPLFLFISGFSLALGKTRNNYELDKKQFFINRFLRIFPIWIVCILIISQTNALKGLNVLTLLFLQTQDIPQPNAFGLAWSIQLEFMCYLLFPVLLSSVSTRKNILSLYSFFLLVRLGLYYVPPNFGWQLSYNSVFGGATLFLTGIFASSLPRLVERRVARIYLACGLVLFCAFAVFIWKSGGYQQPKNDLVNWFFIVQPEILAGVIFLIVRGTITEVTKSNTPLGTRTIPKLTLTARFLNNIIFNGLAHFGRVSYSAYMFSLFTLDFTQRVFGFIKPGGWLPLAASLVLYFAVLTLFATVSFHAIEMPFLRMRRVYVYREAVKAR